MLLLKVQRRKRKIFAKFKEIFNLEKYLIDVKSIKHLHESSITVK